MLISNLRKKKKARLSQIQWLRGAVSINGTVIAVLQNWKKYTAQPCQLCSNNNQTVLGAAGFADAFNFCISKYIPESAPLVCIPTKDCISVNSHHFYHHQNTEKSTFPWKRGCAEWEASARADRPCPREVLRPGNKEGTRQDQALKFRWYKSQQWNKTCS